MSGKPIAAAVFVALMGVVLTIPLRGDDGDEQAIARSSPEPTSTVEPEETDGGEETDGEEADDLAPFPRTGSARNDYPEECLEQVTPEGDGLVAHYVPGGIDVTSLDGTGSITIGDERAFAWSPSGTYLATGSGTIYESGGAIAESLPTEASTFHWGWSPIADCALVADDRGILVVRPGAEPVRLIFQPVEQFVFSLTGGTLAYVRPEEAGVSIWKVDLNTKETEEIARLGTLGEEEEIVLAGWAPDGSDLYYWVGERNRLLGAGENLRSTASESETALPHVLAHNDFVTACADRILAVAGRGGRATQTNKRLVYLEAGGEPTGATSTDDWVISPSCSPDGAFIAAVRSDDPQGAGPKNLALLNADGSLADTLTSGNDYEDAYPMWGPGEAGLMFLRVPSDGSAAEVWHAALGGEPQPTGISIDAPGAPEERRDAWGRFIDWSAVPPTGLSITTEPG